SGLIVERFGAASVLALGTALAGTSYCLAGTSAGFGLLVLALFIGGLGASVQHPLGSVLMARAFAGARSMKALGTYNFAGDLGKMAVPAAASLLLLVMPWRPVLALLGGVCCCDLRADAAARRRDHLECRAARGGRQRGRRPASL